MTGFHIIWTVLLLSIFLGIVIWAWSSKRKSDFEAASRLPLEDDTVGPDEMERRDG